MLMVTQLIGFGAGGSNQVKPPSYAFCDARHDLPTNQNPMTVAGLSFGTESPTRRIVVGIACVNGTAAGEPSSCTIGGVAATLHASRPAPNGTTNAVVQIWSALVPTGTTGTVEWSVPSGDIDGGSIYVWAAYDLASGTSTDTASGTQGGATTTIDLSLDVEAGGGVFAIAGTSGALAETWTWVGATKDGTDDTTVNFQASGAHESDVAAAAPRTVTVATPVGGTNVQAVAVSFR
jgi:hypothetical protein